MNEGVMLQFAAGEWVCNLLESTEQPRPCSSDSWEHPLCTHAPPAASPWSSRLCSQAGGWVSKAAESLHLWNLEGLPFHWLSLPLFPTCTKEKQNHILLSGPKHQWLSYSYSLLLIPWGRLCLSQMHNIFVPWLPMGLLWSFNWVIFIKCLVYAWHVVRAREVFLKEISHRDK